MNGSHPASISEQRLQAYAEAADTVGDMRSVMAAIQRIHADQANLRLERRTHALKGAGHVLSGAIRRLCVTLARSREEARAKVDMLVWARQFYQPTGESRLMIAMIDASIDLETVSWPVSSSRH
jgi:hypothetical protein